MSVSVELVPIHLACSSGSCGHGDRRRRWPGLAAVWLTLLAIAPCDVTGAEPAAAAPSPADDDAAATSNAQGRSVADSPSSREWALALGALALSRLADGDIDRRVVDGDLGRRTRALRTVADLAPFVAFGVAGWRWLTTDGASTPQPAPQRAAVRAGIEAVMLAEVTKLVVNRSRPEAGLGPANFGAGPRADSAFPSIHASLAWAVATPYALEQASDWPYAIASLTNLSRILGRKHWLSDTVAGSIAGHGIGRAAYGAGRRRGGERVSVFVAPGQLWLMAAF